ncbi:MAG TPA: hypothetical protein VLB67_12145, partial [Acidimicrobiia bacterium]|nr:hypothetical protein [Acidimicrobiia bacterium]
MLVTAGVALADQLSVDGDTLAAPGNFIVKECELPQSTTSRATLRNQGNTNYNVGSGVTVTLSTAAAGIVFSGPVTENLTSWENNDEVDFDFTTTVQAGTSAGTYKVTATSTGVGTEKTGQSTTPKDPYVLSADFNVIV